MMFSKGAAANSCGVLRSIFHAAIALALTAAPPSMAEEAPQVKFVAVQGTEFVVTLSDGRALRSRELVGATLSVATGDSAVKLRIESVEPDPGDEGANYRAAPSVILHTFSYQGADGQWRNFCDPGVSGRRQGFPIAGRARPDGTIERADPGVFEITCVSGAQGKCVRLGYHPWETRSDGAPMLAAFNACVRLIRADYSGKGQSSTRDGEKIDIYDNFGIQTKAADPSLEFEAGWTVDGAVCVRHTRVKENANLTSLSESVARLKGRVGAACNEETARALGAILFNRSAP